MEPPADRVTSRALRFLLELGRGGMGVVYLAVARGPAGFQKLKVVKRLRADLAADEQACAMFLDEARLAARLEHPNIVQTNEVGFDGKHYFLEMEYLDGQTYDRLVQRAAGRGGLDLGLAVWVLSQVLAGLEHAHALKDLEGRGLHVVHRDVSPHNVMLTYEGTVKLLDFGIAKARGATSAETQTGVVKGKVTYMAPEQATRRVVDRRADIYAVGVMLWQALTGTRFYGDANDFEIFMLLRKGDEAQRARAVNPGAPAPLEEIAARALSVDPAQRYASAADMQGALERWLTDNPGGGGRVLSARMNELFADHRAAVRAEIETQMRVDAVGQRSRRRCASTLWGNEAPWTSPCWATWHLPRGPTARRLARFTQRGREPSCGSAQRFGVCARSRLAPSSSR